MKEDISLNKKGIKDKFENLDSDGAQVKLFEFRVPVYVTVNVADRKRLEVNSTLPW